MLSKVLALSAVTSALVFAYCDSLDGPVVPLRAKRFSTGDVALVLPWVAPGEEPGIRQAFLRTRAVRAINKEAEGLADTWFFETVVRVHRMGEGASKA